MTHWIVFLGLGFVTTTRITHATPSALYSHSASRKWECDDRLPALAMNQCKDIARQLVEDEPGKNIRVSNNKYISK
jgi:Alkaline phosphatase